MITVTALDADSFGALAPAAASIYGAAMDRSPEVVVQRRDIIAVHVGYRGFVSAGAFDADELVGFGYGYRGAARTVVARHRRWRTSVATVRSAGCATASSSPSSMCCPTTRAAAAVAGC